MAQSRLEKIGTIYSRVTGLYKSGAIKQEQLPLWYPIYEVGGQVRSGQVRSGQVRSVSLATYCQAFPPKYEPRWDRTAEEKPLVKIIYPEDRVRARFYRQFGDGELVNLFSEEKPTSQLFVDKYLALAKTGTFEEQELWDRTVSQLESEGLDLRGSNTSDPARSDNQEFSFNELFNDNKAPPPAAPL